MFAVQKEIFFVIKQNIELQSKIFLFSENFTETIYFSNLILYNLKHVIFFHLKLKISNNKMKQKLQYTTEL